MGIEQESKHARFTRIREKYPEAVDELLDALREDIVDALAANLAQLIAEDVEGATNVPPEAQVLREGDKVRSPHTGEWLTVTKKEGDSNES